MARHNETGKWGEQLAADYLMAEGWAIVARNERSGGVELDIVASRGGDMAFVEVKTRTGADTDPVLAVDMAKQRRLCRAVDTYMRAHRCPLRPRIDVIAVTGTPEKHTLEHIEDAVRPPLYTVG